MRGRRVVPYLNTLSGAGPAPPAPYLGQVATRTYLPDAVNFVNKQLRSRSMHVAKDAIANPTLIFPNFYVDGFGAGATYAELGPGAASTITASIEYPAGTFTQVLFGGVSPGSIPNVGTLAGTCAVAIAKGDVFYVRTFIQNTGGIVFCLGGVGIGVGNVPGNFPLGDVLDAAASGLADNTMGGAYTATSGSSRFSPIIIAAQTALPSFLVIGDSIAYAEDDTGDWSGDVGAVQRWLSPYFANASWGIRGRDAGQFVANSTIQTSFNAYFTHLINEDGVNCFIHGQDAATAAANETALGNKFPTLTKYITTILPSPTSSDNYVTIANQTAPAYEAAKVTENSRRRGIPAPYFGVFDSAVALETALNSGVVQIINPTGSMHFFDSTVSSVHPVKWGYAAVREKNRAQARTLSRNGAPLNFGNTVIIDQVDAAQDATSQTTYTFATAKPNGFLLGPVSAFKRVFACFTARFGTTGATLNSVKVGGVAFTKVDEAINITGGAESIQSLWSALMPAGNPYGDVSATFSTAMLRCGVELWTAIGDTAAPSVASSADGQGVANVASLTALAVPAGGGAIMFASTVNGTVPTITQNAVAPLAVTLVGGTMYSSSGAWVQAGNRTFSATWSAGASTTLVGVVVGP